MDVPVLSWPAPLGCVCVTNASVVALISLSLSLLRAHTGIGPTHLLHAFAIARSRPDPCLLSFALPCHHGLGLLLQAASQEHQWAPPIPPASFSASAGPTSAAAVDTPAAQALAVQSFIPYVLGVLTGDAALVALFEGLRRSQGAWVC